LFVLISIGFFTFCCGNDSEQCNQEQTAQEEVIKVEEVITAQKQWGKGIVKIGEVYLEGGDYVQAATDHIQNLYAYDMTNVLFKPTLVSETQFRTDFEGALSYFVGGNEKYTEDHGFAIKPWTNVRWENAGIHIIGNMAVAMGNYYFTEHETQNEVKVEYSFAYTKDTIGKMRIILHDSHLPYSPPQH